MEELLRDGCVTIVHVQLKQPLGSLHRSAVAHSYALHDLIVVLRAFMERYPNNRGALSLSAPPNRVYFGSSAMRVEVERAASIVVAA